MNILFIGLLYNPEEEKEILKHSNVGLSIASNIYQWNVINGLASNLGSKCITVCGSVPYGNYPKLSDKFFLKDRVIHYKDRKYRELGFINFYFIKHKIREYKIKNYISQWLKQQEGNDNIVIFYDLYKPFLNQLKWLKNKHNVKSCLIVPDLTGKYRNETSSNKLKNFVLSLGTNNVFQKATLADYHVLLTNQMKDVIKTERSIVVDGIVSERNDESVHIIQDKEKNQNNDCRIFMYAGYLSQEYNIDKMLSSFSQIKSNHMELWICGKGPMEDYVKKAQSLDPRIKYLGLVDKGALNKLEQNITFYINPRSNTGIFTKYSFPSKDLEYLLAGKPVLCFKLWGMSDEYDDVLMYIHNDSVASFKEMFERACAMTNEEIQVKGYAGREFVLKNKNAIKQTARIIEMFQNNRD